MAFIPLTLGLLPVLLFLAALVLLDTFKLVRPQRVLWTVGMGALIAAISYQINTLVLQWFTLDRGTFTRYAAPLIEECAKAAYVLLLLRGHRIGFLVDGVICGFAVGAGFAFVENLYYFRHLPDAPAAVWLVRGLGTAVMHGGTTALFAMVVSRVQENTGARRSHGRLVLSGLLLASSLHSFYNHFFLHPLLQTATIAFTLPVIFMHLFRHSEQAIRHWLGSEFDTDQALLQAISTGAISESPAGKYLQSLRGRYPGTVVADMLCYLRLYVELSLRAKGMLLLAESGFPTAPPQDLTGKVAEMQYLEKSIGRAGMLTLLPFLHRSPRDLWQLQFVGAGPKTRALRTRSKNKIEHPRGG